MIKKVVLCTGGFDPIHSGHIEYLNAAKQLGDILVVGINSDAWLERKKGRAFMCANDRVAIIQNLKSVNHCILFDDSNGSAIEAIKNVKLLYKDSQIIFANGGDRTKENIPEMEYFTDVQFVFGVGTTNKLNSSSKLLQEWKEPSTKRPWGEYRELYNVDGTRVKELTINPGQSLSLQRHKYRNEYWHVAEGTCKVDIMTKKGGAVGVELLHKHDNYLIPTNRWHQLSNPTDALCKVVEIQYGKLCVEEDIERLDK